MQTDAIAVTTLGVLALIFCSETNARPLRTIVADVTAFAQPAADFNPLMASDVELQDEGFPPRPNALSSPKEFALWKKVVTAPQERIVPTLEVQPHKFHGPAMPSMGAHRTRNGIVISPSNNWSGYSIRNATQPFTKVYGEWIVPVVPQCAGATDTYSSQWIGLDGETNSGSNDVLQTGTEVDSWSFSVPGCNRQAYFAWFEWYPKPEVRITNFAPNGGDLVFAQVWTTSPKVGHIFIEDFTQQTSFSLTVGARPDTTVLGASAEWIVERPTVNKKITPLSNYVVTPFNFAYAKDKADVLYQPGDSPSGTVQEDWMIDSKTGDVLSLPSLEGPQGIWLTGPGSNPPPP